MLTAQPFHAHEKHIQCLSSRFQSKRLPTSLNPEKDRATHLSRHRVSPLSVLTFPNLESRSIVGYAHFVEPVSWEDDN